MKQKYLLSFFSIFALSLSAQITTIDFETDGSGYTLSAEATGTGTTDLFNRTSSAGFGGNNTFFFAYEDISGGQPSTLTIDQITVTGSTSFNMSLDLLIPNTNDWDTTDQVVVSYSIDGGGFTQWFAIESIVGASSSNNAAALDLDNDGSGDTSYLLPAITDDDAEGVGSTFKTFTIPAVALSGNNTLDVKFEIYRLDANDEGIYIDNIIITEDALTWDGSTDNDWSTAANWTPATVPSSTSNVFIPNDVTNFPTTPSSAITVNTVNIASRATLDTQNASSFSGTVTYNRSLGTTNWYLLSSPINGEIMTDMRANNSFADGSGGSRIGFAPYDNSQTTSSARWAYFTTSSTDALVNGKGYSTKLAYTGDVAFSGTINTSDVSITLEQGAGGGGNDFNLLGNPFTAFINSNTFLTNEIADLTEQTIWVWNQVTTSYDAKNLASGFKVAPGQGFFVEANTTNSVSFTETMQSHESSDTFQKSNSFTIKLNLGDGTNNKYSEFYYLANATTGYDNGYDSELFSGVSNPFAIYSHLVSDSAGKDYQIQSLPDSNYENMIVPLGVNATSGKELTFSLNTQNLPSGYKVFLEDKNNGSHTRLDEANTEYKITLSSDLNGIGRFYLHTKTSTLNVLDFDIDNISIYKSSKDNLRITGLQNGNISVSLFDILGKRVLTDSFKANTIKNITLPALKAGIYIVQLITDQGKINKKIIIE